MKRRVTVLTVLLWIPILAIVSFPVEADDRAVVAVDSATLPEVARAVPIGGELRIEDVSLGLESGATAFNLERFRVFAEGAGVLVHGAEGSEPLAPPNNAWFHGWVESDPYSVAFLTVREGGGMRGLVASRGRYWVVGGGPGSGGPAIGLALREIDARTELAPQAADWSCASGYLRDASSLLDSLYSSAGAASGPPVETFGIDSPATAHTARIAIETDFEFFQNFGSSADAIDYIGDVIGYGSIIYASEVNTSWEIESIQLYTTPADPWSESPGLCALFELGRYWNDNRSGVDRTLVHMMSGRSPSVGVAWVGVLCNGPFNYDHQGACPNLVPANDNYGGDYGFSGNLSGSFDINNPTAVWDIVVVTHEIGHNFDSPHTHCYNGISGSDPIDRCHNGQCGSNCYCGTESLPDGCPGPGQGCGTIMSYCHLLGGGLSNISLTLGTAHPYGIDPTRVPERMLAHVQAAAAGDPQCLAPVQPGEIFSDGFESGDTSAWSGSQGG